MNPSRLPSAPCDRPTPADQRRLEHARTLVAAMTVDERIAMLHQHSPGVARLGIEPFVTGTEALHGMAWKGPATQFPQPVGMAASWDPELLGEAAQVTAAEVRELHAEDPRVSLNVWAPVVNTLRHPLWGRTEEGYSEDPLLNAELASGFCRGLRGSGTDWQVLPTLKHFLAYSNETDRCVTDSQLSARVLHEYELPGFIEPVARGGAAAVMLSYNLVNGRPAHVTDLLDSQLRTHLPDPDLLFVVTDAGAPSNLFRAEKVVPDAAEAHAAMLRAGADSFTDHGADPTETISAVTEALERGLIDLAHIDRAVVRQLVARARTGEFDDRPGSAAQPTSRSARRALAREVATRSAVLLSHREPRALPLPAGRIAVLGEQAHTVLSDWYSGDLIDPVPLAEALAAHAEEPSGAARRDVVTSRLLSEVTLAVRSTEARSGAPDSPVGPDPVLLGADRSLRCDRPAARTAVTAPAAQGAPTRFAVLNLGEDVVALRETTTGLLVAPDDRGQLAASAARLGGWVVQETFRRVHVAEGLWQLQHVGSGRFVGVEQHTGALVLRSAVASGGARFEAAVQTDRTTQFAEATAGAEAVVLVIGNEPHVHGRETEDRPHAQLMGPDREAAELLAALPDTVATVLVLTSSYPYDLQGLEERVGAVVWSAHAGEAEGEALAALLTGERDFSGRLAQTWPDSSPLPSVLDYDVIATGSTYLYGQGARFPFGHGLALDETAWSAPRVEADADALTVATTLTAPASRRTHGPLHEVVQVYADLPAASFSRRAYEVPCTRLIGFAAVEVPDSGEVTAQVRIPWQRLALFAPDLEAWELPDGPATVRLARSSTLTVRQVEVRVPAEARAPELARACAEEIVPAYRAEHLDQLLFAPASLLEGTELRPRTLAGGTAEFVLPAGTEVTALLTAPLPGADPAAAVGTAELLAPTPSAAPDPAPPLPHRVVADGDRPTGRVRVRLAGPLALRGLRVRRP